MSKVLLLRESPPCSDVVSGLRGLADRIEAGEIVFPVSTCVVLLGHTSEKPVDGEIYYSADHSVYGYGPRCDTFTVRGLMAEAQAHF